MRQSAMLWIGMVITATVVAAGCSQMSSRLGSPSDNTPALTGAQEVPPVNTTASGTSLITISADKTVDGSVRTTNLNGTAAHIHLAAPGQNGPVIMTLIKTGEGVWSVPPSAMLTSAQYDAYIGGNLYVNVHSAANPGGEIRAQLK
jgi:hypothetical protein